MVAILIKVAKRGQTCLLGTSGLYLKYCWWWERNVDHPIFHFLLQRRSICTLCPVTGKRNTAKKQKGSDNWKNTSLHRCSFYQVEKMYGGQGFKRTRRFQALTRNAIQNINEFISGLYWKQNSVVNQLVCPSGRDS